MDDMDPDMLILEKFLEVSGQRNLFLDLYVWPERKAWGDGVVSLFPKIMGQFPKLNMHKYHKHHLGIEILSSGPDQGGALKEFTVGDLALQR